MNKKFVSKSNYVLHKVLNNENCLSILKDFIEAILEIKIEEIGLNKYLEKKQKYLPKEENFGIADVRIRTSDNEEINVGIQFVDGIYIQTKMLMYYGQIHLNQQEYDDNREFARTTTINILDFNYFSTKEYQKKITISSNEYDLKLEEIDLNVIELPKFNIENIEHMSRKEQWIIYLKGTSKELIEKVKKDNDKIKELDKLLNKYWLNERME